MLLYLRAVAFCASSLVILSMAAGCSTRGAAGRGRDAGPGAGSDSGGTGGVCIPAGPSVACVGNTAIQCSPSGEEGARTDCAASGQVCTTGIGCSLCSPNRRGCMGNQTVTCNAEGTALIPGETCAAGVSCEPLTGRCLDLCEAARTSNSYIGCEYWAMTVINEPLAPEFEFAIVVANPQTVSAEVTVVQGERSIATRTVAPGALETISLPYVAGLKEPMRTRVGSGGEAVESAASALVRDGAYRVRSSVPVTVYQFNALQYSIPRDCAAEDAEDRGDNRCFSYTNDASLLLPTHVLTGNYLIASWATHVLKIEQSVGGFPLGSSIGSTPGFFALAATADATSVEITFKGNVQAAASGGTVRAFNAGETGTFMLDAGDVLQITSRGTGECPSGSPTDNAGDDFEMIEVTYCNVGRSYDLTGTEIRATAPVSVIGGHSCAFVPTNRWACDHLEEAVFPLESWGKSVLISRTQPLRNEPNYVRVISGRDGNTITFEPASVHAPVTLARGEFVDFETRQDVRISGSEAILVAQFLVGQDYAGLSTGGDMGLGDPDMSIAVPQEQFRSDYTVLAPESYTMSFINITAPDTATVMLDGTSVGAFTPIPGTGFGTARVAVSGGAHHLTSTARFGVLVYGFGEYTSYMYPGGLDFEDINIPF